MEEVKAVSIVKPMTAEIIRQMRAEGMTMQEVFDNMVVAEDCWEQLDKAVDNGFKAYSHLESAVEALNEMPHDFWRLQNALLEKIREAKHAVHDANHAIVVALKDRDREHFEVIAEINRQLKSR